MIKRGDIRINMCHQRFKCPRLYSSISIFWPRSNLMWSFLLHLRLVTGIPPVSQCPDRLIANVVFSRLFLSLLRAHLVRPRPHCLECQHGVSGTLPRFVRICSHHVIFSQTLPRWEICSLFIVCKQTLFCREKVTGDGPMFGLGNTKPPLFSFLCSFFALFSLSRCLFSLFYTVFLAPSH